MGKTTSGMGGLSPGDGAKDQGDCVCAFLGAFRYKVSSLLFFPLPFSGLVFFELEEAKGFATVPFTFYFRRVMDFRSVHELFQWE